MSSVEFMKTMLSNDEMHVPSHRHLPHSAQPFLCGCGASMFDDKMHEGS
jgi:hypothetical protein